MTFAIAETAAGITFAVKVVPGASRNRLAGAYGDALKVQVSAPPEGGRANERLCEVVAEALGVPPRAVTVVAGALSPRKTLRVAGLDAATARARLGLPA